MVSRGSRALSCRALACAVMFGNCVPCESQESTVSATGAAVVTACNKLIDAKSSPFPFPAERSSAVCTCVNDRLGKNERIQTLFEVLTKKNATSTDADRTYFMAKVAAATAACIGADLEVIAESATQLAQPGVLSWLETLGASVPAILPAENQPTKAGARKCSKPPYPPPAIRAEATGSVTLSFYVEPDGRASKVRILQSSGDTAAHKLLDLTAATYLMECQFRPGTTDGKAVGSWANIQYVWKIE